MWLKPKETQEYSEKFLWLDWGQSTTITFLNSVHEDPPEIDYHKLVVGSDAFYVQCSDSCPICEANVTNDWKLKKKSGYFFTVLEEFPKDGKTFSPPRLRVRLGNVFDAEAINGLLETHDDIRGIKVELSRNNKLDNSKSAECGSIGKFISKHEVTEKALTVKECISKYFLTDPTKIKEVLNQCL